MKVLLLLAAVVLLQQTNASFNVFQPLSEDSETLYEAEIDADVGEPLILTPYLQEGKIAEAQAAALVDDPIFQGVTSYTGYFTVDSRFDSNLWFWFFPSADNVKEDPVVLWLNGGPGVSSLDGLFLENGPFIINIDRTLSLREYSWHRNHSIIFIDNPVGVGYSFTKGGLAENETKVGEDLYSGLSQFFQLFPELQENPFYISGETYAGKFLSALGYTILDKNPDSDLKINLQGILIGNGWTDPINQINYGPLVYNTGLVSLEIKEEIDTIVTEAVEAYGKGELHIAELKWLNISSIISEATDVNIYNYLEDYADPRLWPIFLNQRRKIIHVGNVTFGDKGARTALRDDIFQSVAPWVEVLLENYRTLIYTGQVNIICGYPMALNFLSTLNFTGAEAYKNADRLIWYLGEEPAGYVRVGGNLVELLVRNAGLMVPRDQPKAAYDMVYKFTRNIPFA